MHPQTVAVTEAAALLHGQVASAQAALRHTWREDRAWVLLIADSSMYVSREGDGYAVATLTAEMPDALRGDEEAAKAFAMLWNTVMLNDEQRTAGLAIHAVHERAALTHLITQARGMLGKLGVTVH